MRCIFTHLRSCTTRIGGKYWSVLLPAIVSLWIGWPRVGITEVQSGTLILVGDVLRFNQRNVWNRITELAADLVIIAAASDRPKLYGEFARRALQRHGAFAEVIPLAVDFSEFGTDFRRVVVDRTLVDKVREAGGVYFVGGAPQRLAEVLLDADGSPTPMGKAVTEAYATGGVIVGGIPGSVGLFTGIDALEVLAGGRVSPAYLYRGLGLVANGWLVDQHVFTVGRFAEVLMAMRQIGITHGLGIGVNTAAVVKDGRVDVVGEEGVLLIDLSGSQAVDGLAEGFRLAGVRLSYLEHGDSFNMSTLEVRPAAVKLDGFEIDPDEEERQPSEPAPPAATDLLAKGGLLELLREALDGSRREAIGLAFSEDSDGDERGYRFRFHSVAETAGWLSIDSGVERYTILNVGLDVSLVTRTEMSVP